MSSLAAASRGVPIPVDEIHSALRSVAVPGYTGALQLELVVKPEAVQHVAIVVTRRHALESNTREEVPAVGDHLRKKSVQRAVDGLRDELVLRPVVPGRGSPLRGRRAEESHHRGVVRICMKADEESYIVPQKDLGEIIRTHNEGALEEFLKDPLSVVAGAVNELLLHPTAIASNAVRVAHATLKGKLFEQVAKEVKDLREKGTLPDNFADKKNGYNTWVDLLKIIDDECPDEDRLEALKAMFLAANRVNAADADRIVAYELFQIAKTLSSNELLVLRALGRLAEEGTAPETETDFLTYMQQRLGHSQVELIRLGFRRLPQMGLAVSYHLTDLGRRFCEVIKQYRIDTDNP